MQTKGDGPVDLLVADFTAPENMRAYARFDDERLAQATAAGQTSPEELLGTGILAFTIDQGVGMQPYQGIVPLDGSSLEEIASVYFRQSEQLPTRVRLGVAEFFDRDSEGKPRRGWRAGGIIAQFCRRRRSVCAPVTFMAAMAMKARSVKPKTMPGRKRWR